MLTWKIWQRIMIGVSCIALVLLVMHLAGTWLPFLPCTAAFASIILSDRAQRVLLMNESVLVVIPPSIAPEPQKVMEAAPVKVALKKATPVKENSPKLIKEKILKAAKEPQPAKEEKVKEVKPKPVEKPQAPADKKITTRVKKTTSAARKKAKKKS
jgi:outer membrane biosynthesis protein TonB